MQENLYNSEYIIASLNKTVVIYAEFPIYHKYIISANFLNGLERLIRLYSIKFVHVLFIQKLNRLLFTRVDILYANTFVRLTCRTRRGQIFYGTV